MGSGLLYIAHSGLSATKKQLRTASHNIANANTEGFSRQRAETKTNPPVGFGNIVLGTGTNIKSVKRIHDKYVEKRLADATTQNSYHKERTYQLEQVEQIFNEMHTDGLNSSINKFFNAFRELSKQPENETVRSIVRENAKIMINDFRRSKEYLNEMNTKMDQQLNGAITDINTLLETVKTLNNKIRELEAAHDETGDLRDQRDLAVKTLSEYFELEVYTNDIGQYTVQAEGVGALVVGGTLQPLKVERLPRASNGLAGGVEIYFKNRGTNPISDYFGKGRLKGILDTRNKDVKQLRDRLDALAFNLAHSVNAIHRRGFANKKVDVDLNGNIIGKKSGVTGINFFSIGNSPMDAGSLIGLGEDIKENLNNIATAFDPNSPGDNRISIAISKLQHEKILNDGTATFEEDYQSAIGTVGMATAKSKIDFEHSEGLLAQARSVRERISGVSLDEETANMMKYQQAFDASARVMRVADEMFKTVLGIMP